MARNNYTLKDSGVWVDVTDASEAELREVSVEFNLNWHQVKNCMNPDHLPSHENIGNATFIMTRFFSVQANLHVHTMQEITSKIAIFYSDKFIITVHRPEVAFINEIVSSGLQEDTCSSPSNILGILLLHILRTYEAAALKLSGQIDDYESTIVLKTLKAPMLKGLYYLKRKAGICKRLLIMKGEIIRFVSSLDVEDATKRDTDDIFLKLTNWFDQIIEDVNNLLNTYLSLSAHKTNEVMKTLTIFSIFFLPLTFIVGVYGMNFKGMPELTMRGGYPAVWILMIAVTAFIYFFLKRKRWF